MTRQVTTPPVAVGYEPSIAWCELDRYVTSAAPAPDLAGAVEPVPSFMPVTCEGMPVDRAARPA